MINFLMCLLLSVIVVEAVTEILADSKFFNWFRAWLYPKNFNINTVSCFINNIRLYLFALFNCGYCLSVWVSALVAYMALGIYRLDNFDGLPDWIKWLGVTFILHRLSNWLHVVYEYVRKGRIVTVDVTHRQDSVEILPLDREEQSE